jgi:hypothetical protein
MHLGKGRLKLASQSRDGRFENVPPLSNLPTSGDIAIEECDIDVIGKRLASTDLSDDLPSHEMPTTRMDDESDDSDSMTDIQMSDPQFPKTPKRPVRVLLNTKLRRASAPSLSKYAVRSLLAGEASSILLAYDLDVRHRRKMLRRNARTGMKMDIDRDVPQQRFNENVPFVGHHSSP